jgi:hypothetical protein
MRDARAAVKALKQWWCTPSEIVIHTIIINLPLYTPLFQLSIGMSAPATSTSAKVATSGHFRATEQAQIFSYN